MEKIIRQIGKIYRNLEYVTNVDFGDVDLGNNLYAYLLRVYENPGIISGQLADMISTDKTSVSRSIKKLINQDLIEYKFSETNKKEKHLYVTKSGELFCKNVVIPEHEYTEKKLLNSLSEDEIIFLNRVLEKLVINSDQEKYQVKEDGKRHGYLY